MIVTHPAAPPIAPPRPKPEPPALIGTILIPVHVTAEDIRAGKRGTPDWCPIALAMLRTFEAPRRPVRRSEGVSWPMVYGNAARSLAGVALPSGRCVSVPAIYDFISRFDAGAAVAPFTFEIEVPS